MTREDFSSRLRFYRDQNAVMLKTLCYVLNMEQSSIYRIEKATHNYSVQKTLQYANAVGAQIVMTHPNRDETVLHSVEQAVEFLKAARGATSVYKAAKDTGYSKRGIASFESGNSALSIDMLLKLAEYYGYEVIVRGK